MKKIPCVFQRDFSDKRNPKILSEVTPGCEWVLAGEGVATRKWDGTSCLVRAGRLYKRYDAKKGKEPPAGFEPAQEPDPVTGHHPGWLPVDVRNPDPADVWHALAWYQCIARSSIVRAEDADFDVAALPVGTYELIGPRIGSNHEQEDTYHFVMHGARLLRDCELRTFVGLCDYLGAHSEMEGIVFWRKPGDTSGDMAKLTRENFGFPWPVMK